MVPIVMSWLAYMELYEYSYIHSQLMSKNNCIQKCILYRVLIGQILWVTMLFSMVGVVTNEEKIIICHFNTE